MKLPIYLDYSATTPVDPRVAEKMMQFMTMDGTFGNPASRSHRFGWQAEEAVDIARNQIADLVGADPREIVFTSGATESDNLAIKGAANFYQKKGKHIITSKTEHKAVLDTCRQLEREGFEVTYLAPQSNGIIDLQALEAAMRDDTILVSIMHVNNEIGSVMPIEEIGKIIKENNPNTLFHVDSVQGYGKFKINPKKSGIDLMSISGHKIHGPKGIGVLYIADKTKISPIIFGGGQQKGLRSGTENVIGIAGIGLAAEIIYKDFDEKIDRLYEIKDYFVKELLKIEGVSVNAITDNIRETAPHIVSASIKGVRAEVMLHTLEDKGIYVSSGSACASNKPSISATLKSIGLQHDLLDSTIRFSMSVETTREDIEQTLLVLNEVIPMLRKYSRH